jgi:hypothetical protein
MGTFVRDPLPPVLDGFADDALDPQVVEAVKQLRLAAASYALQVQAIDTQYLKPLESAHDGDSPACLAIHAQLAAARAL